MPRASFLLMGLLATLAVALAAAPASAQQYAYGAWTVAGLPTPPKNGFGSTGDPSVDRLIREGHLETRYVQGCSSYTNGQQYNQASPLPVGNGWTLGCYLDPRFIVLDMVVVSSDTRATWCWRGGAVNYRSVSDPHLQVWVTPGAWGQQNWWLQANGQPGWVQPVSLKNGQTWPLWLEVGYQTIALAPSVNGRCENVLPPLR